ncbi:MSCRAMM family protein [Agromyces bauzanensis]|uniref:SD-repeat containing protein B domain-containing protein n=1 Tax=Agromyces bauzanensis TaxID=1308924 RepID=A0A917UTG1_9MICO|nr:carboxypeptidase regulatory-like domain-containing protein [Agromyces bauzanensis]GGJ83850.1 hypothetical protein GCM10011372_22770 [Agromyces bauzanensis]
MRIQAIGSDGAALTAAELGFQGGFNYCAPGVVGKPSCTGVATDVPAWDPATLTLTGNAAAADTSGAAAWFEPSTPISSPTFVFTRRAGFPVYQTWFASLARDITGTVTDVCTGPVDGVEMTLIDGNGTVVATTTTAGGGLYSFPGFFATGGYTVQATPPAGKIAVDANRKPADLTTTDAVVDFSIRDLVPVAVSGRVTDTDDNPMPGVTVTIDGVTTTTDSNGYHLFDTVPAGTHTATITTPDGYTLATSPPPFTIPEGSETPITGVDFVVAANPTLSGAVTAAGTGVPGVTVTAVGPAGTLTTVTAADGTYSFPLLPAGDYEVTMTTPDGYLVVGASTRTESVADADVTNVDFELARTGSVEGVVEDEDGIPISDVTVTVTGPDGPTTLTTGADGDYTITITVPAGYESVAPATRTITITAAGEAIADQDFVLSAAATPAPTPGPTPGSGSSPAGTLPATGVDPAVASVGWSAVLAVGAGALLVVAARLRRRATR